MLWFMRIIIMLYCADANQLIVSDLLKNEFEKLGCFCCVKDIVSYRYENHGSDELAFMSGLYCDLRNDGFDAILFLHSYPARLFSTVKAIKKLKTSSFILQTDFSLHFEYFKLDIDMFFVPHEKLAEDYVSHGISSSNVVVSGIPSVDLTFSDYVAVRDDVFCLILADGYETEDVLVITRNAREIPGLDISFAVLTFDNTLYRTYGRYSDFEENFVVYGYDDIFCLKNLGKPDIIITNSSNVNIYSAMKCKSPIILFDPDARSETENFSFLSFLDCFLTCESFDDVFNALKYRIFEKNLGFMLSEKSNMNSKADAVRTVCENIISFNNKKAINEKR